MSFIPEKLTSIERALVAAATMSAPDARMVLRLICEGGMTTTQKVEQPMSEGTKHYAKREPFINNTKSACTRVLKYAKHETLRNIEKHFRASPPIHGAEGDPTRPEPSTGSLAARLTFKKQGFSSELLAALREEAASALTVAGQAVFDELGLDDPWKMPGKVATAFLDGRENLLSEVPDEVHKGIMTSIEEGLKAGETRKELMARIASKFDEISKGRAETIANTETAAAFNFARDKAMREAGVTHKKWLHSQSPLIKEPRPTHVAADGQVRPIDEPFDVGGVPMMRPGDESAGPEEIINCHCVAIPVEAPVKSGEGEGHSFRGNQYITVYRGSLKPEPGHPRLRDFGVVFSATDQDMAAQYGSFVTKWGIENPKLLDTSSMEAQLLAEHFSGQRYNSVADWEDVFFDYYGAPTKQFAKFLASKGYDGFQTGKDIAIFDPSKMVRL